MNDGGSAFPQITSELTGDHNSDARYMEVSSFGGMSLRDWFAGLAMQGLWASPLNRGNGYEADALSAYEMADAMLAQRERQS